MKTVTYIKNSKVDFGRNKGSTSILVVFMMIVLITMGTFSITTANSNIVFSERLLDWNHTYYELDAKGEEFLFELDELLYKAQENVIHDPIKANEYFIEVENLLKEENLYPFTIEKTSNFLRLSTTIYAVDENDKTFLDVSVLIHPIENDERFSIATWKESQQAFDYSNTFDIWDGKFE